MYQNINKIKDQQEASALLCASPRGMFVETTHSIQKSKQEKYSDSYFWADRMLRSLSLSAGTGLEPESIRMEHGERREDIMSDSASDGGSESLIVRGRCRLRSSGTRRGLRVCVVAARQSLRGLGLAPGRELSALPFGKFSG